MNWMLPELAILLMEQEIPNRKRRVIIRKPERFIWVCKRRDVARQIAAALEGTGGEWNIHPRYPRQIGGEWTGPRWVVVAWMLTKEELHAIQRIAPKLDPSATGLHWDEAEECYRAKGASCRRV